MSGRERAPRATQRSCWSVAAFPTLVAFLWSTMHPAMVWAGPSRVAESGAAQLSRVSDAPPAGPQKSTPAKLKSTSTSRVSTESSKTAANASRIGPGIPLPESKAIALPKADHGVSAQSIALPGAAATVGGLGESFSAQLTTGIATLNVPFAVPGARGGVGPALGLVYSSSGGYGLAGVGWSLVGQAAIARQTDRGVPKYDDKPTWHPEQDRFVFGADELVPICTVSATGCAGALAGEAMPPWATGWQYFRPRVEGAFLRYFWSPNHRTWRIQSKSGTTLELGAPLDGSGYAGGLEANPTRPSEIYRWHLVRQYDTHGEVDVAQPQPVNVAVYRYVSDGAIKYLSDVFLTSPASDAGTSNLEQFAHHVRLAYELRPDSVISYRAGFAQDQRLRLTRVDVASKPFSTVTTAPRELVRKYHLEYDGTSHASVLNSVQMEGRCTNAVEEVSGALGPTACPRLPKQSFEYTHVSGPNQPLTDVQGLAFEKLNETVHKLPNSPPHSLDESDTSLMDVNSDSLPDVVVTAPILFSGKHGLYLNGAGGALGFSGALGMTVAGVPAVDTNILKLANSNVAGLDLDGDATIDLVHMPMVKQYSVFTPKLIGSQWTWQGRPITTATGLSPKIDFSTSADRVAVADVNGDGLVDVVFSSALEVQTFFALGRYPDGDGRFGQATWSGAASAQLSEEPVTACTPWSATPIYIGDPDVRLADMNGDGLPDLVRVRSGQIFYWPGRGNGFWGTGERDDCKGGQFGQGRHVAMQDAPNFGITGAGVLEVADVNGDGLSDLVEVRFDAVDVYLNINGVGWTPRQILSSVPIKPNTGNIVRFADVDGSGTVDMVWGQGYDYRYIDLAGGIRPNILIRSHNGLGKTTELEYSTSAKLMLDAAANGDQWSRVMPLSVPVVVRVTVRDNLEKVGRAPGAYVTEYSYRDPVFEGRQREFRGFSQAITRSLGDANSPTATTRSTFLLGECQAAQSGYDVCAPAQRWRDNWREPLKGLPVLVETFDDAGVYLSTSHTTYELKQLYSGLDGRRVSVANTVAQESFLYDTTSFVPSGQVASLVEVDVKLDGIVQTETRNVTRRGAGAVKLRTRQVIDSFGNPSEAIADGCVEGCSAQDEVITTHTTYERPPGDASGWLFRPMATFVTGSVHAEARRQVFYEYDARGDLERAKARLWGTLLLDRFREGGGAVAPTPPEASGGATAPTDLVTVEYQRDAFGNVTATRAAVDRCRAVQLDAEYASFPVAETVYAGDRGQDGCGTRLLTTTAEYDRGLGVLTDLVGVTGQPARVEYDGFGRIIARRFADPASPGQLAVLPAVTYSYSLPADPTTTPYSVLVVQSQDGPTPSSSEYLEQRSFVDGLGRSLAVLSEADPAAGDGGDWVVGGIVHFDAKGAAFRAFESSFHTGAASTYSLATVPTSGFSSQQYDAFGRAIAQYGFDGQMKARTYHRALSRDVWDAEDLAAGLHQGTYASVDGDGHGRPVKTIERIRVGGVLQQRSTVREYLPTGDVLRIIQRAPGAPDTVRWMRYDSLGRLVLNAEPNTSTDFSPDASTDPSAIKAWRYAYNDAGDLVGTSDARGCGVNYHFEAAGRMVAEDYSPCLANHAAYTALTDIGAGAGAEALYRYDLPDPETAAIVDGAGLGFTVDVGQLPGRLVSVADRGSKGVVRYDARGRVTGTAMRIARPMGATPSDPGTYANRWYIQERTLDAADRGVSLTTGATVTELLGSGAASKTIASYTRRGTLSHIDSSYGTLVASQKYSADRLVTSTVFGDQATTQRAFSYDQLRRLRSVQTYRAGPALWTSPGYTPATDPTQQLLLEDYDFSYDEVGNITEIKDWRVPGEWPAGSKPVSRRLEYDDLYRLTRVRYDHPTGGDPWTSPFAAENADPSQQPQPSPHVSFSERVKEQRYSYDHLGNTTRTTDDVSGFYDRSLGNVDNGTSSTGPHQLRSASNRALSPSSPRKGDLSASYDAAGNLAQLITRRDGACLPLGASCWQRFAYGWDELGRLVEARRWDLAAGAERTAHGGLTQSPPARVPDVLLRYIYDASGQRVVKTAVDTAGVERHTVYVFATLELRRTWWISGGDAVTTDYALTPATEGVRLPAAGVTARVIYSEEDLPSQASGNQHVFLELADYLGSTTSIIDRATGELVEHSTYMAYGGADSDYRPGRWGSFREPYKFSGKEEDVEVGLQYFGARYLVVGLGRWASADAATVHALRSDPNPYSYVGGRPTALVDPNGNEPLTAIVVGMVVGALLAGGMSAAGQSTGRVDWGWKGVGGAMAAGALGGGLAGGLAAAGAGVWSAAAGGAGSSGATAASSGQSVGGVLVAAGLGAAAGLAAGGLSAGVRDAQLAALEGSGMSLGTAIHLSTATSGIATGIASSIGTEAAMAAAYENYQADYARAAGVGAGAGLAGYLGTAAAGGVQQPRAYSTADSAGVGAALQNQVDANATGLETGSLVYKWGSAYYHTQGVRSASTTNMEWEDLGSAWMPGGAVEVGFHHSHPPPPPGMAGLQGLAEHRVAFDGGVLIERGGIHPGDVEAAKYRANQVGARTYSSWVSTHYGYLDAYTFSAGGSQSFRSSYIPALTGSRYNSSFVQAPIR